MQDYVLVDISVQIGLEHHVNLDSLQSIVLSIQLVFDLEHRAITSFPKLLYKVECFEVSTALYERPDFLRLMDDPEFLVWIEVVELYNTDRLKLV